MPRFIVYAEHPVLTEEEQARRMKEIEKAAARLIIAADRVRKEKEKCKTSN